MLGGIFVTVRRNETDCTDANVALFSDREIFMEKHWKSVIKRSICDYFFEAQKKVSKPS